MVVKLKPLSLLPVALSIATVLAQMGASFSGIESPLLGIALLACAAVIGVGSLAWAGYEAVRSRRPKPSPLWTPEPLPAKRDNTFRYAVAFAVVIQVLLWSGEAWAPIVSQATAGLLGTMMMVVVVGYACRGLGRIRFWWRRYRRDPYH